jgi:signal transduction histidine kinase/CheY-like chemotaxis protein
VSARPAAWSAAVFLAVAGMGALLVTQDGRARRAERRQAASTVAEGAAHAVAQQVSVALSATYALAAMVVQHGEVRDFEGVAEEMLRVYRGVSSLQLAPGGVIRRIHPLAGNEAALGHDLLADPARNAEARAAVDSRRLTLAGPFTLRQGGVGLVGRYPVFVRDASGAESFWGFTNALVRLPELLEAAQLDRLERDGWSWTLARRRPDGGDLEVFAATPGAPPPDPVRSTFRVPNGDWTLALAPRAGWGDLWQAAAGYGLALVAGLAFALLAWRLARHPDVLRRQVASRTAELKEAYRRLEQDVAGRRRAEEQLAQAQRMEAIGQLAGGVAHDFNNLLAGILGCALEVKAEAAPGSPSLEAARTIEEAAMRGADLTRQLLGFARRGKYRSAPVDLHAVVAEVLRLLSRTADKRVAIEQRLAAERSVVLGDSGQLQQAVLNLAVNALDAMPQSGTLTISTAQERLGQAELRSPGAAPGPYLALAVADTGHGIPASLQERIFEPFFTTKEPGRGTGMGLATVYGIAGNHGGWVTVQSEEGRGARFVVHLPLFEGALAPEIPAGKAPAAEAPSASGCVLVVDDEEMVRDAAARLLRRLGYRVEVAPGGREAVDHLRGHPGEVDAVLLDLAMPGLDGRETFHALRGVDPAVRVVLSSGYGRDGRAQELLDEGVLEFVEKPYRLDQLAGALARAVAARHEPR